MAYNNIIVDSSVWVALFSEEDALHTKALEFIHLYIQEQIMPDVVFYETLTVLKIKLKDRFPDVDHFTEFATESAHISIQLLYEHNRETLKLFKSPFGAGLSYVDTLLLYLSRDNHIVTFDKELQKRIKQFGGYIIEI